MKLEGKKLVWFLSVLVVPIMYGGLAIPGNLEPPGAPAPTMRTLEELQPSWSKKISDASKRFEVVLDGAAVLDKETGLVWEKSPDTTLRTWSTAVSYAYTKEVGGRKGWRLPTVEELASLVDTSVSGFPKLPSGHPFTNVQTSYYWSSTTGTSGASYAFFVFFYDGLVINDGVKSASIFVWCVRGGHGYDTR